MDKIVYVIISLLLSFLAGYMFGRRKGLKEGEELGALYAPLHIREQSLKNGKCEICQAPVDCLKSTSVIE